MNKQTFILSIFSLLAIIYIIQSCTFDELPDNNLPEGTTYIPPSPQRTTGNPDDGWDYLRYDNYLGAGIPLDIFKNFFPDDNENVLNRTGENATIPPSFNAFDMDAVSVVGGFTCFHCHSGKLNGEFIPGLGNSFSDYTADFTFLYNVIDGLVSNQYGTNSPEWNAYQPLSRGAKATAPYIQAPFRGVNTAAMLEIASVAHRNPNDLTWSDQPLYDISNIPIIASDVPPLWHLNKKNALYYTGLGRGDFTKHLMQVIVVAIEDSTEARVINNNFDDVMAWIKTLEPPVYPNAIDQNLADEGKAIFENTCSKCHGTYGENETYPNLLVDVNQVKTDTAYASLFYQDNELDNWFNSSWLSLAPFPAEAVPSMGYVAPPLDGVWATAPYFHNGSVPTLEDVLYSPNRPMYWSRTFDDNDYDFTKMGWNYSVESAAGGVTIYNTTMNGYSNRGHYYADHLIESERQALLEYLKTL